MGEHTQHSYLQEAYELQNPPGWRTPGICEVAAHRGMAALPPMFLGLDWLLFGIKRGTQYPWDSMPGDKRRAKTSDSKARPRPTTGWKTTGLDAFPVEVWAEC